MDDLPPKAKAWMREQIASGRYGSEAELMLAALRVLAAFEAGELQKLDSLRRDVAAGLAEIQAGMVEDWDIEEIKAEGRRRLALQTSEA